MTFRENNTSLNYKQGLIFFSELLGFFFSLHEVMNLTHLSTTLICFFMLLLYGIT